MSDAVDRLFLDFQGALAGRYSLERELGRGGMGVVYLAREVRLDRLVAIKLLPPELAAVPGLRDRFLREARMAARLSHPNIVPIFAVDDVDRFVFYAMAFVDGETLAHRVQTRGPLPPGEATRLLREVAWALAYAHAQGVIHRDVKPENILLEASGRALVTDFGIARVTRETGATGPGEVIGTPEFMSPEQAVGDTVDGRADLYSLGAVGYFALQGTPPFAGGSAASLLSQHIATPVPLLEGPGIPRRLARALERCLAKDPAARPQKGEDFAESLGQVLQAHKELPVALRVFVKRGGRLGGMGGLVYLLFSWAFLGLAVSVAPHGREIMAFWLAFGAAFGVGPIFMLAFRARRFLASGFDPKDLPAAFQAELEQGLDERVFEYGRRASAYERVTGVIAAVGVGTAVTAAFMGGLSGVGGSAFVAFSWAALTSITSGFLYLTRLNRRVDLDTKIWSWVWRGPIGRALFAIARPFVGRRSIPAAGTHRATELALSLAAEQLYDALPKATRARLRELPDALHRLESDAQRMRARLDELQDALAGGDTPAPDPADPIGQRRVDVRRALDTERALVERRHADAVSALESIRLSLLRLHAGTGSVESLTTDLGLAREVAAEVDRLLAAQQELDG